MLHVFNEQCDITKVKYLNLPLLSLLPHLLQVHLVALLTGDGQAHHQGHKLLKVHLSVSVGVQIFHDLVDRGGVLLRLKGAGGQKEPHLPTLIISEGLVSEVRLPLSDLVNVMQASAGCPQTSCIGHCKSLV